jgi:hypothetical protein
MPTSRPHRASGGREHGRGQSLTGGTHLSVKWAHVWLGWAGLGLMGQNQFFFLQGISKLFSFYFIYGFQIKIKPNSNNFKHVHKKRIIWLSMMQHFMTHIGFVIINK